MTERTRSGLFERVLGVWRKLNADSHADVSEGRATYDALIKLHRANLLRAARRLCSRNEDQAQDLVQEAFVRGYEAFQRGRFIPGSSAGAWLLRVMTNVFINDYRRHKHWDAQVNLDSLTVSGEGGPLEVLADPAEGPDSELMSHALDEALEKALQLLPPEMRACVVLVDVEGMEYSDAAKALGIPIGTVRSRLSRARFQLHAILFNYAQSRRWL